MTLRIETGIPFGNACDTRVRADGGVAIVEFAADPHGGPERLWFCLRLVREGDAPAAMKLVLKHPETMLGGQVVEKLRPVVRTPRADWRRLPGGAREFLPDGRCQAVWPMDTPTDWIEVALCYPYGPAEVDALVADAEGYWRPDTIGVSQSARPIVRLSNAPGEPGGDRPGVYLVARQHAGEVPGSWALDGLLRRLADLGDAAPLVWAVPTANIDGVVQGDYGKDSFPYDLNRAWGIPPMRHEVMVLQHDMVRWKGRCRPVLAIDFHGPGGGEAEGAYFYIPDADDEPAQHDVAQRWAEALADAAGPDFMAKDFARVARYASRWETPSFRYWCRDAVGVCSLCLETPYALACETLLTREAYRQLGARLADGIVHELEP